MKSTVVWPVWVILLCLGFAPIAVAQEKGAKRLKFEDTLRGGQDIYRLTSTAWRWSDDGSVLFSAGKYYDPKTGAEVEAPKPSESKATESNPTDRRRRRPGGNRAAGEIGTQTTDDGKFSSFVRVEEAEVKGVHKTATAEIAYTTKVKAKNLFVRDETTKEEWAVSKDGSEELFYGQLDWVYQEEVYGRGDFNAMWWSPNGKYLAYLRIDESAVHEFTVVDHIPNRGEDEVTNYPKSGDPNPVATLWVWNRETKTSTAVDLSKWQDSEPLIVRVGWNPAGDKVVFEIQDRIQTWLELVYADPSTGAVTPIVKETSETWVNVIDLPLWQDDGSFFWWSDRTGYQHLYHYAADGQLIRAVTSGEFDVDSIMKKDLPGGNIWVVAKKASAVGRHVYRVSMKDGSMVHLTPERGTHQVMFNADQTMLIDSFTSLDNPGKIVLRDADGKEIRVLSETKFSTDYGFSNTELVEIKARDGFPMDAAITKPHDFDPSKKYPVMLFTYSGPNAPTVADRWSAAVWYQFLAQEGVIIFQCNNRTSSGKGQIWTGKCYKQFGVSELQDLEDGVAWLVAQGYANADKVGISGWSYGGFMSAYALTHSKAFALGLAGAGVHDWRLYDTIYTERYMSTPQLNPDGYAKSSVVAAAKNLHGRLHLAHGTMDDNVHLQNSIQLLYQLQLAGKDCGVMFYPKSRHGLGSMQQNTHYRRTQWQEIQEALLDRKVGDV